MHRHTPPTTEVPAQHTQAPPTKDIPAFTGDRSLLPLFWATLLRARPEFCILSRWGSILCLLCLVHVSLSLCVILSLLRLSMSSRLSEHSHIALPALQSSAALG